MQAKVSRRGLRYFAHDPGASACPAAGETVAHRELKAVLADAARCAGWTAVLEADPCGRDTGGWRADVLVSAPGASTRRVALEAQLSAMTAEVGAERTARYHVDGIETLWVTTRDAPWLLRLPSIKVGNDPANGLVVARGLAKHRTTWTLNVMPHPPLRRIVTAFLAGGVVPHRIGSAYDEIRRGDRRIEVFYDDTVALVKLADIKKEHQQHARIAEQMRIKDAERARHQAALKALLDRQAALLPTVVAHAREVSQAVWIGTGQKWLEPGRTPALADAGGNRVTAGGALVWVRAPGGHIRLFAVVSPVAARIEPWMGGSWRHHGVRVYVSHVAEAARVAANLGWATRALNLHPFPPSSQPS